MKQEYGQAYIKLLTFENNRTVILQEAEERLNEIRHSITIYSEQLADALETGDENIVKQIRIKIRTAKVNIVELEDEVGLLRQRQNKPTKALIETAKRVLDENKLHLQNINKQYNALVKRLSNAFESYLKIVAEVKQIEDLSQSLQNQRSHAHKYMPKGTPFEYAAGLPEENILNLRNGPIFLALNTDRIVRTYQKGEVVT